MPDLRSVPLPAAVFSLLLLAGCGSGTDESAAPPPPTPDALHDTLESRVEAMLALADQRTEAVTLTLPDGSEVEGRSRRPREVEWPWSTWTPNPTMRHETPGETLETYTLGELPAALLVDDDGTV